MTTERGEAPAALLAVGQMFFDAVFTGLPTPPTAGREIWTPDFATGPGGIANQAVAAARLGARTAIAAFVGDDAFSRLCLEALSKEGVDTTACSRVPDWRLPMTASIAHGDDRAMITGGVPAPVSGLLPSGAPVARTAVADLSAVSGWIADAARAGTAVYATIGWDATGAWDPAALSLLQHCAAFQPNADEARAYTGRTDPVEAARVLAEQVPLAVVTLGRRGVVAVDSANSRVVRRPPVSVTAVDATGAGDVFGAALAVSELTAWTLEERLDFASLVAAITVSTPGGATTAPHITALTPWLDAHPAAADADRFDFLRRALAEGRPPLFTTIYPATTAPTTTAPPRSTP